MVIDTSAVVAIFFEEEDQLRYAAAIEGASTRLVIAHPTLASGWPGDCAASAERRASSTEARLALAVLTTERKAA